MIYYIMAYGIYFIFEKIKNKILCKTMHTGVKMICYHNKKDIKAYDYLIDWVFL
jgi:hypothetical protein